MIDNLNHFEKSYRIYFKDTDTGGVVYHARYVEILEMGRSDLFAKLGYSIRKILEQDGLAFPVYELKVNYLSPAFLEDILTLRLTIDKIKGAKMFFAYTITNQNKELIIKASTINVLVNVKRNWRPMAIDKIFPHLLDKDNWAN